MNGFPEIKKASIKNIKPIGGLVNTIVFMILERTHAASVVRIHILKKLSPSEYGKLSSKTSPTGPWNIPSFRKHLEKSFKAGMTWENQGKGGWDIDHKSIIS